MGLSNLHTCYKTWVWFNRGMTKIIVSRRNYDFEIYITLIFIFGRHLMTLLKLDIVIYLMNYISTVCSGYGNYIHETIVCMQYIAFGHNNCAQTNYSYFCNIIIKWYSINKGVSSKISMSINCFRYVVTTQTTYTFEVQLFGFAFIVYNVKWRALVNITITLPLESTNGYIK